MAEKHAPLKKLYTDDNDIDAGALFDLLSPFVKINKTSKNIIFLDDAHNQPVKNKILLFLLAKKALFLLGDAETDRVKPSVITEETGIPRGSILPGLKALREQKGGNLLSSQNGEYYISSYQVTKIKNNNFLNKHGKAE